MSNLLACKHSVEFLTGNGIVQCFFVLAEKNLTAVLAASFAVMS